MKAKYTTLTLKITVVTPVHINSGNILFEDRDFYLNENQFRRIDYSNLLSRLLPEENTEKLLLQIRDSGIRSLLPKPKKSKKTEIEEDWKQILRAKVGLADPGEEQIASEDSEVEPLLDEAELYRQDIDFQREEMGNRIQEMVIDTYNRSFFPGSSIKGAIRTALYVNTLIQQPGRLSRLRFTWTSDPVEADYPLSREMTGIDRQQPGKDVFRQLYVHDSDRLSAANTLSLQQIKIMNIGETQILWKKGPKKNVGTHQEADPLYWEMLKPETEFTVPIMIDEGLKSLMREIKSANEMAPFEINPETLMAALNVFGKRVMEQELAYAEKYGVYFLRDFYNELMAKCSSDSAARYAYIPIGSGIPWHGKTVGDLLDASSLDAIRRHFYRYMGKFVHTPSGESFHGMKLRKGQLPKSGKQIRSDKLTCVEPFPKTRHIIFQESRPAMPPGWICLQLQ